MQSGRIDDETIRAVGSAVVDGRFHGVCVTLEGHQCSDAIQLITLSTYARLCAYMQVLPLLCSYSASNLEDTTTVVF
jgi:hypothetical protein